MPDRLPDPRILGRQPVPVRFVLGQDLLQSLEQRLGAGRVLTRPLKPFDVSTHTLDLSTAVPDRFFGFALHQALPQACDANHARNYVTGCIDGRL